jgi:hypothetical protein
MQMNSRLRKSLLVISLVFCLMLACVHKQQISKARLVELWVGGDDGLTSQLGDAVERVLRSSPDFIMSSGHKLGTLIVTIPTHVQFEHIGERSKVFFTVNFSSIHNENLGSSKGTCMDNELVKCANQIIKDAILASHGMN